MTLINDWLSGTRLGAWIQRCRESRRLVLVIVAIALLLDNMLLTIVVPIIPEFLYDINHPNAPLDGRPVITTTTTTKKPPCDKFVKMLSQLSPEFNESLYATTTTSYENLTQLEEFEKAQKHEDLVEETVAVGMLFASKAFVQLLANPFVGPLTHKIGYSVPMFAGFIIMFLSTIIFAFGRSYSVLFIARALQGIGSSCSSVSGMGMLAERYPDDKERGNAMGIALGGLALGVLIGPPFGGLMYEFVGKSAPFLVLAALALGDGLTNAATISSPSRIRPPIIASTDHGSIYYDSSRLIPLATNINHLIVPNAGLGFAIGMVDSSMMPELGYLVDIRHSAVYGSVYAIGDVAFCLGFAIGPALSGTLIKNIGFEWMLFGIAMLDFLYAPLLFSLKSPPTKEEKKSLITGDHSSVRYVTYQNDEEDE
ncbi:hypothetical protein HUJ04_009062 [Dendroctonus ponderosae]|nr:hypothetical protein HUJ04_009062 [Dendroctonus ponderosae]